MVIEVVLGVGGGVFFVMVGRVVVMVVAVAVVYSGGCNQGCGVVMAMQWWQ